MPPAAPYRQGVSVTIPLWEEPPMELTLALTTVGYSADPAKLLLSAKNVWDYSGGGQGAFSYVSFQSHVLLGGSADLAIGLATSDGDKVATVDVTGSLTLGISECGGRVCCCGCVPVCGCPGLVGTPTVALLPTVVAICAPHLLHPPHTCPCYLPDPTYRPGPRARRPGRR